MVAPLNWSFLSGLVSLDFKPLRKSTMTLIVKPHCFTISRSCLYIFLTMERKLIWLCVFTLLSIFDVSDGAVVLDKATESDALFLDVLTKIDAMQNKIDRLETTNHDLKTELFQTTVRFQSQIDKLNKDIIALKGTVEDKCKGQLIITDQDITESKELSLQYNNQSSKMKRSTRNRDRGGLFVTYYYYKTNYIHSLVV